MIVNGQIRHKHWTPAEDAELRERCRRHENFRDIAKAMSRPPRGVTWRMMHLGLVAREWTPEEDARMREAYGHMPRRQLAAELHRSELAIKCRAQTLGLRHPIRWTAEQIAIVRELWPTQTAAQIAARFPGRRPSAIHSLAQQVGLPSKCERHDDETVNAVKRMHAAGKPIRVIAKKLGLTYDSVKGLQDRFKLPTITDVESKRQGVKTQLRRLGLKSLAELRSRAHKKFVLENGWPAEWQLRVREVQILNFLIAHGPSTARQIAEAIGANTDRAFRTGYPRRVLLTDSGRDGTYTASLLKKNLIIRTERRAKGAPARRLPCLYHPSAETIAYFEEHHGSNTHSQPA